MAKEKFEKVRLVGGSVGMIMSCYGPKPVLAPEDGGGSGGQGAVETDTSSAVSSVVDKATSVAPDNTKPGDVLFEDGDAESGAEQGAKDDDKGQDGDDDKDKAPEVPETYEFEMPEGVEVDQEAVDKFSPVFKELGLTNEQAQKLVNLRSQEVQAQVDQFENTKKGWREQIANDPELGGTNLKASQDKARAAFNEHGTPELADMLVNSGLSDHPEVRRLFVKLHDLVGDDELLGGAGGGGAEKTQEAALKRMYPTMG